MVDGKRLTGAASGRDSLSCFFPLGLTEESKLNCRLEMYNFFNHTQIWSVGTSFSADAPGAGISANNRGAFGKPTGFRDPRTLQLGIKISF